MKPTNAVEVAVDAFAVHRLTRLVQDDEVWPMPELREAHLRLADDTRWADLASCAWCASFWIARALADSAFAGHLVHVSN